MMSKNKPDNQLPFIPWSTGDLWQEANDTIRHLVDHRADDLKNARSIAQSILNDMVWVFPIMDELCALTCPHCKEPCCRVATLWFDYRDLIFFHLDGIAIAEAQPLACSSDSCRYLGERGCILRREERPWICTFYLCPSQTFRLRRKNRVLFKELDMRLSAIKNKRIKLEEEFIRSIT